MKKIREFIWKVKAFYYYTTILSCYDVKFCWSMAGASLENINYDTSEDPEDCVREELSYWGD